jgi:transporter family-2 protein
MGMQKRSLNKVKAVSLTVSLVGILIMAASGDGTFALLFILLGILAGALTMTQMVLNSTLAIYKGAIRASHQNFIGGLVAGLVFYFLLQGEQTLGGLATTAGLPFLLVFSGGTLAVFVVVSTSYVIVKIPAVYSALLLSSSQILMSLAIDTVFFDSFSLPLLLGSLLMLLGMGGNLFADKKANP